MKKFILISIFISLSGATFSQHWSDAFGTYHNQNPYQNMEVDFTLHCNSSFEGNNACAYNVVYKDKDTAKVLADFFAKCDEICKSAGINLTFNEFDVSLAFNLGLLDSDMIEIYDGEYALKVNDRETDVTNMYIDMNDTQIRISLFYPK